MQEVFNCIFEFGGNITPATKKFAVISDNLLRPGCVNEGRTQLFKPLKYIAVIEMTKKKSTGSNVFYGD